MESGVHPAADGAASVPGRERAGPVGRQRQLLRQACQLLGPVGELPGHPAAGGPFVAQHPALPEAVVGVLDGQLGRPAGLAALAPGRVGGGQVLGERCDGPAVRDDVVHHHQEGVFGGPGAEQEGPQREFGLQREALGQGRAQPLRLLLGPALDDGRPDAAVVGGLDQLVRDARGLREDRAQALVPGEHVCQRTVERFPVEGAGQPDRQRDVVRGGQALDLVEEPQPALREGQWHRLRAGFRPQGGHGRVGVAEEGGDPRDRRVAEQRADGEFDAQLGADAADQLGGEQRVTAQVEEVVRGADGGQAEDVGEQRADGRRPRGTLGRRRGRGRRRGGGRGQGPLVELAVRGQRQRVEQFDGGGDHVGGQDSRGVQAQAGGVRRRTGGRHGVRHQALVARPVLADDHRGPLDARVAFERGLDLAEFDAEAADLHLAVRAPEVAEAPVVEHAGQVAGAVHAAAGGAEGVGHEAFGGQAGPPEVAPGQARAGHVELAGGAFRHRPQLAVQDVHVEVGDRLADHAAPGGAHRLAVEGGVGDVHGRLGDAVHVDQARRVVAVACVPVLQPVRLQRLAAEDDVAQRQPSGEVGAFPLGGDELVEGRGGLVEDGHPFPDEQPQEVGRGAAGVEGHHDEPAAVQQRPPDLPHREVERVGVEERPHVVGAEAEPVVRLPEEAQDVVVGDRHALGPAGGTGGVDDVGQTVRAGCGRALGGGRVGAGEPGQLGGERGVVQEQRVHGAADAVGAVGVGEHQGRGGVLQGEPQAVRGVLGVERQVAGARLEDGEQGDHQVGAARQGEGGQPAGAQAPAQEQSGEAVGALVELPVGEPRRAAGHRGAVGGACRLGLERLVQGGAARLGGRGGAGAAARGRGGHRYPGERGARVGLGEGGEEAGEPPVVGGQFGLTVAAGVGLEGDGEAAGLRVVADDDGEVVDGPGGDGGDGRPAAGEVQLPVVVLDVDQRAGELPSDHAEVAQDVLAAVALVTAELAQPLGGVVQQGGDGGAPRHRQPQGQHVDDDAGGLGGGAPAAGHGDAQRDVLGLRHAVQVASECGDHECGPVGGPVGLPRVEDAGGADGEGVDGRAVEGPAGEGDGVRGAEHALGPVGAIGPETLGGPVAGLGADEVVEGAEPARAGLRAGRLGGVGVSYTHL